MITKLVLNEILYQVGMSWIIRSNNEMKYEMDESDNTDWLNIGPWYNTAICSRLCGSMFEDLYHTQEPTDMISGVL